jgi:hypothetical protein
MCSKLIFCHSNIGRNTGQNCCPRTCTFTETVSCGTSAGCFERVTRTITTAVAQRTAGCADSVIERNVSCSAGCGDCVVVANAWSACTVTCGDGGTQTRTRSVAVAQSGAGSACGSVTPDTRPCEGSPPCVVDTPAPASTAPATTSSIIPQTPTPTSSAMPTTVTSPTTAASPSTLTLPSPSIVDMSTTTGTATTGPDVDATSVSSSTTVADAPASGKFEPWMIGVIVGAAVLALIVGLAVFFVAKRRREPPKAAADSAAAELKQSPHAGSGVPHASPVPRGRDSASASVYDDVSDVHNSSAVAYSAPDSTLVF